MPKPSAAAALVLAVLAIAPVTSSAGAPIRVVEGSLPLPDGMDTEEALASVEDIARIFELYEPAIPKIPGIQVDLAKEVVSQAGPTILELPVTGNAIGHRFDERARVTASAESTPCPADPAAGAASIGRKITLDFHASSYNIERRIDRIEITACPARDRDGRAQINAVGRMYAGYKPEDPDLNPISEAIGSKALQGAFIRQVPAVFRAVERHWATLGRSAP